MKNHYVTISRDPFARTETIRSVEAPYEHRQDGCAECGGFRAKGVLTLFRYATEKDGGGVSREAKAFCSKSCRDTYYS